MPSPPSLRPGPSLASSHPSAPYATWLAAVVRQSLGVEPVDPAVMRRPPRRANDPILNRALGTRVLTNAALITAGTLYVYWKEMGHDGVVSRRDTTMTFTTFVMFDMFNAMACRHAEKPVIHLHPLSNIPLVLALGGSILGQLLVIYFPPLQVPPTHPHHADSRQMVKGRACGICA